MAGDRDPGGLYLRLKAAQAAMRAALTDVLSDIGITPPQLLALRALERSPAISNAELARQCFVTPQAMVTTLVRLQRAGLLERVKGSGRIIETHLTEVGRETLDRAVDRVAEAERYLRDTLGTARVDALRETLEELTSALERTQVVTSVRSWSTDE